MLRHSWIRRTEWFAVVALILGAGALAQAQEDHKADKELHDEIKGKLKIIAPDGDPMKHKLLHAPNLTAPALGKYWLGVAMSPEGLSKVARAQLDLPEEGGVVILRTMPDSPGAKAGLKDHDIILEANDKPLKDFRELITAVNDSEGKAISLKVVSGGKTKTIEVTPEERPKPVLKSAQDAPSTENRLATTEDVQAFLKKHHPELSKHLEGRLGKLHGAPLGMPGPGHAFGWRGRGPGVVLGKPGGLDLKKMPNNLKVSITKEGDGPAKIVIERGDEKWEVTEDNLDELPEDIRPFVRNITSKQGAQRFRFKGVEDGKTIEKDMDVHVLRDNPKFFDFRVLTDEDFNVESPKDRDRAQVKIHKMLHKDGKSMEKQLDQMRKEMREMAKQMRELRESLEKK